MPINDFVRQRVRPLAVAATSHFFLYSILSTVAVLAAVVNALKNHSNFYSVAIYLSKSSRSVLILANFCFLFALLCGRVLQQIFLGPLQSREVERLYDRLWFFVTESLLAFTIFRDEFDIPFAFMFGFLLFIKCFHWLMADRIDTMDQVAYPGPPPIFHVRMNCLFGLLTFTDFAMFIFAVESTLTHGVGGTLLFASEYAILMASSFNAMAKYVLSVVDLRRARSRGGATAPAWENKSMYIFYIELATDFLKLTTYLTFCALIVTFYGLPLNIIRDVYMTSRSFITRLRALVRYRTATRNMDERYPSATAEEMAALTDGTCIICREEMVLPNAGSAPREQAGNGPSSQPQASVSDGPNMTPKKLPCGHIFHFHCLRSWLERQQSCPTCRRTVLETNTQPGRQAAQAGGRPPPPHPGAAPVAPNMLNFFGGAQGQQAQGQQGQPPQANAPGFFGRVFGGAVQPPLGPGQVADQRNQIPLRFEPLQMAWNQPQPLFYQQAPQQPLQPVPIFQGFHGPGGVWQPWGMDPQWFAPGQQVHPQGGANEPPRPTRTSSQSSGNPPTAPVTVSQPPEPSPIPGPSVTGSESDRPPAPRDAAALAALRRFNSTGSRSANVTSSSRASSSPPGGMSADTATKNRSPSPVNPQTDTAPTSSNNGTTGTSSNPSITAPTISSNPDVRPDVPQLIPLYDFSHRQGNPYQQPGSVASFSTPPSPYGPIPGFRPPNSSVRSQPQPQFQFAQRPQQPGSQQNSFRPPLNPANQNQQARRTRPPLSRLPETLTEAQLTRLDGLTRDAIDERIRILDGVSGTVYRCVEELLRVRSVMPAATATWRGSSQTRGSEQRPRTQAQAGSSSSPSSEGPAPVNVANGDVPTSLNETISASETIGALEDVRDLIAEEMLRTADRISEAVSDDADATLVTDPSEPQNPAQTETSREGQEGEGDVV